MTTQRSGLEKQRESAVGVAGEYVGLVLILRSQDEWQSLWWLGLAMMLIVVLGSGGKLMQLAFESSTACLLSDDGHTIPLARSLARCVSV